MDADLDGHGRIVVGYADGCVDACVTGGPGSFTRRGYVARQMDGKPLLAAFDPPPPAPVPGSASLTGTRDPLGVDLSWSTPSSGTAPITGYVVERSDNGGVFRAVANVAATAAKYSDTTAISATVSYAYRVSAKNVNGTGPASNVVAPALPAENICLAPGLTIAKEGTGDTATIVTVVGQPVGAPAPAQDDLTLLSVSEPYLAGGNLTLTFEMKTAGTSGSPLPPSTAWFTSFRNAANVAYAVRMITDNTGTPRFESYKVAPASSGAYRGDFVDGTPKPALPGSGYAPSTGTITIVVSAADVGVAAAGESINSLLSISTQLVSAGVTASQPIDIMPNDGVGVGNVKTVPVGQCGPNHAPVPVLSATAIGPRRNLYVHFDASRSYDPDAGSSDPQLRDTIVKYVFDFGDGTAPVATTSPTVDHQYAQDGQYGATLLVQDSRGKASDSGAVKQICEKCLKGK
jgi:hypothetical protein